MDQKQSNSKNFNCKKPHSKNSGENSLPNTKEDSDWSCRKILTMKCLLAKRLTRKDPCVIIFVTKFLTKKSYSAKIWLPKFKHWRFLQKKINCKSFKSNSKIFNSTKSDEKKNLTVKNQMTYISKKKSKRERFLAQKIYGNMFQSKTIQAEKSTAMGVILKSLRKRLTLRSQTATIWWRKVKH